jgi:molybdopterin molybdotransferase
MSSAESEAGVEWHEARRRAGAAASVPEVAAVSLAESIGLVLAGDIVARQAIPHFASSAMDGWAVVGSAPWMLGPPDRVAPGAAWPVVTGQQLPVGVRGVLRSENGTTVGSEVRPNDRASAGEPAQGHHVRLPATEATRGEVVVRAGCIINPAHVALAAACGLDELSVHPRPAVAILTTGDELTSAGVPSPGWVRDSFGPQLPAVVAMLGGAVTSSTGVRDDEDATVSAITVATARLVITTGGTGRSSADHLRASLSRLGATMVIPALAMRPGGPTMLARLPGGQLVLCLAGNPLAALMGLISVGAPVLVALAGRAEASTHRIRLGEDVPGSAAATRLLPYVLDSGFATPTAWAGSAMMRGLASAEGVLVVPPAGAIAGGEVEALPLPWST